MYVRPNSLLYGDNLEWLPLIDAESVDLVYLDPPFNSNRAYNVLFNKPGAEDLAQIQAFDDTWRWTGETANQFADMIAGGVPARVADALTAFRTLVGENDLLAYLVNMAPRLVQMHRVLRPTGSIWLHCDPTASHYLKVLLDAIFGIRNFRNEVVWKRSTAHSDGKQGSKQAGRIHDILLFYTKTDKWTWNTIYTDYDEAYALSKYRFVEEGTGRRYRKGDLTAAKPGGDTSYEWNGVRPYSGRFWAYSRERMEAFEKEGRLVYTSTGMPEYKRYLDEMPGVPLQDIWTDLDPINSQAAERLGYPTQKPVALLERILKSSSNEGDVILDPFCGCGTSLDAAVNLDRKWIGIDITYIAVNLIQNRLRDTHGEEIDKTYRVEGIPRDLAGAQALFDQSAFDFERWAVSLVDGTPNEKQVGDRGIDGVIRFYLDPRGGTGRVLVSVKGGKSISPTFLRDLVGTVESQKAEMGLLITMAEPTRGIKEAVAHSGTYTWPVNGARYPRVQTITVRELLNFRRPQMPPPLPPYQEAKRRVRPRGDQLALFEGL